MKNDNKPHPLVILGLDAGDDSFVRRWAAEGYLPTIASIMRRGWWGRTAGPELINEHATWACLLSGVSRRDHGCYYFRQLKPGTYDLESVTPFESGVRPWWSHLRGLDCKIAVVDAPETKPLDGLPGIQLANWAVHNPLSSSASSLPVELLQDVRRIFGEQDIIDEDLHSDFDEDKQLYERLFRRIEKKGRLCRELLAGDAYDFIFINFGESHTGSHQFWKYRPEARTGDATTSGTELTHAIRNIYQEIDRQMGALLAMLPEDANVFVVSQVGLQDEFPSGGLTEAFCRQLGYQASPPGKAKSVKPIDLARRILPESWRIWLSRYMSRGAQENFVAERFRSSTDWSRTSAFAIPSNYMGYLRVNLRGREPEGTVERGAEYESLLRRLEDDLRQLIDPQTGTPAVTEIFRTTEVFGCTPHDSLPDLFVNWGPAAHFRPRLLHPRAELTQVKPGFFRDSDHSRYGFVAAAGGQIQQRGEIEDVSLLDLAPTFLHLLGQPQPREMSGQVLGSLVASLPHLVR